MNRIRKLLVTATLVAVAGVGFTGVSPAGAATAPRAAASFYPGHFECSTNSTYHWVKQHWPDMTSATGSVERVQFLSEIQVWNGSQWQHGAWSAIDSAGQWQWLQGASNSFGRMDLSIVYSAGGYPWQTWFIFMDGRRTPDQDGVKWNVEPRRYYRTVEYYYWPATGAIKSALSTTGQYASSAVGSSYCYVP